MILIIMSKTHGRFEILYDKEDDHIIQGHTWHIQKIKNRFYAGTNIKSEDGKYKKRYLHQMIMNPPKGMDTDHINGNTCDNRRQNLRVCTRSENMQNRGKQKTNTSGFVGVVASGKNWKAQMRHEGKHIYFGTYRTRAEAARARDRGVVKLRKVVYSQMLNYPEEHGFAEL